MRYTNLDGAEQDSEVWCPGAEHDSVWLVNGALVKLKTRTEIEWHSPDFTVAKVDPGVVEYAQDILRRWWQSDPDNTSYRMKVGLPVPERPTEDEVNLAATVVAQQNIRSEAHRLALNHHVASTPVSVTRIRELGDFELCVSETDSSEE